ncbi:MAG: DinB family protein [Actinobacteria bacterium]|nr:MAG: DinB family protein [Actinomycetota bacterium]
MSDAAAFGARLDAVEGRLRGLAATAPVPTAMTDPDQPSGERWEWGQVWAHLAEFVPYWSGQIGRALASDPAAPPAFGRVKTDAARVAAIESDRHRPPAELWGRLDRQLVDLRALLAGLADADWDRRVRHPTLGILDMPMVVEEFLVGHLESHADQLDGLVRASSPGSPSASRS